MNKSAIIDFVDNARESLEKLVRIRAYEYGVSDGGAEENLQVINGKVLSNEERGQRDALISAIKTAEDGKGFAHGFDSVMEEAAYTWFNRFIAIRFMEVNGYLPSHTRIFSDESGTFNPQILEEATTVAIDGIDHVKVSEYIQNHQTDALFKYLIILQCNELSKPIPEMFEKISDYSELLFPNGLLKKDSVIAKMVEEVPEDDWKDQIQIIGWMYQFYIAKKKKAVSASKETVTKSTIAAVTQLFTPDWIVRYMAENSIGRLWLESNPDSSLKKEMKFFVEDAEQPEDIKEKINSIKYTSVDPKNIKIIEPCCGSGHILVYCFDLLYKIYVERGYSPRDIPSLILQNNLTGLDIDRRASQLACFSLIMKARSVDSGFFRRGVSPHVFEIEDTSSINELDLSKEFEEANFSKRTEDIALYLTETFNNAKIIGSLLKVQKKDYVNFQSEIQDHLANTKTFGLFEQEFYSNTLPRLLYVAKIAQILSDKYDVMITTPPYLGISMLEPSAKAYANSYYPESKTDMFAMFMETDFVKPNGFLAMINMHSWMFLGSYADFRPKLAKTSEFLSVVHLGPHAFEAIGGEVVQTVTFVLRKTPVDCNTKFIRLVDCQDKEAAFLGEREQRTFIIKPSWCSRFPDFQFFYWCPVEAADVFSKSFQVHDISILNCGISTGKDSCFIREWWETSSTNTSLSNNDLSKLQSEYKWFPITKGGETRKWYGNLTEVIDLYNNAFDIKHREHNNYRLRDASLYFKECITWTKISSALSFRFTPSNVIYGDGGPTLFSKDHLLYLLGFLNSNVAEYLKKGLNPTFNTYLEDILSLPIKVEDEEQIVSIVKQCISIAKEDWDSFETSWEFDRNPLIKSAGFDLADSFDKWSKECEIRRQRLIDLEEQLNSSFIAYYGLEGALSKEVDRNESADFLTNPGKEAKSLLSYFVGLIFGRYSLDENGVVFSGGSWSGSKYSSFQPDKNGIEVINSGFFGDESLDNKCLALVRNLYGDASFENNISFLSNALGGKGSPRETIVNYFLNGFYLDHLKVYKKCPIYWLFDAGKKNSFKALIYVHRYTSDTLATLRTDYILPLLDRYSSRIDYLSKELPTLSGNESTKATKEIETLKGQFQELSEYEPKVHHLADQHILINLDDGVTANYERLADVLAPLK